MLQETAGLGKPSASHIKTLCVPSSPSCLVRCLISGAPATRRKSLDAHEKGNDFEVAASNASTQWATFGKQEDK